MRSSGFCARMSWPQTVGGQMTVKLSGSQSKTRVLLAVGNWLCNLGPARYALIRYSVNLFARMGSMQISATKCLLLSNCENQALVASELGMYF